MSWNWHVTGAGWRASSRADARLLGGSLGRGQGMSSVHKRTHSRSWAMPTPSVSHRPRGPVPGSWARRCSQAESLRLCASSWAGASVGGSAPRWSWHTASHRRVHDPELRGRRHRRGVDALAARGADFERYDGLAQDERGVFREKGFIHSLVQGSVRQCAFGPAGEVAATWGKVKKATLGGSQHTKGGINADQRCNHLRN
jgi:hypothetical protein